MQKRDELVLANGSLSPELMKAVGLRKRRSTFTKKELYAIYEEFEIKTKEFEIIDSAKTIP